jgi:hypothetical protein
MIKWINEQIQWFKEFLSDGDGHASSKRLMSFLVVLAFLQSYVRVSFVTNTIQDIPMNWAFVLPAILGIGVIANKIENGK